MSVKIIKSSNPQNLSTNNIMLKSFKTIHNSKEGGTEWSKVNRHLWKERSLSYLIESNEDLTGINYGIPCGLVNKIVVVDMDLYKVKEGESEFIKVFGEDYVKLFNTLTIKTGSGGEHLYFKWDKDIKQTTCAKHQIDIRNNGGYVIAPGSSINGNIYSIMNDTTIKECPSELKSWLLLNIYRQPRQVVKKVKKDKKGEIVNPACKEDLEEQDEIDFSCYDYNFSDDVLDKIVDSLPKKYFNDYQDWLIFTTCMRTLDKKDKWIEYNEKYIDKKCYDKDSSWSKEKEMDNWDRVNHRCISTLPLLLRESGFIQQDLSEDMKESFNKYLTETKYIKARAKFYQYLNTCNDPKWGKPVNETPITFLEKSVELKDFYEKVKDLITYDFTLTTLVKKFLGYYMYKPTNNHTIQPDKVISGQRYLDGDTEGSFFCNITNRYIICKSDTGTGKTTAFKNYTLKTGNPFISIVSRLSLGKEQHKVFKEAGIESNWFKDINGWLGRYEGDNMIIQIDSLFKIADWESISGYTLFLDEFNSLVEYFIDCPTLNDKRVSIKKILEHFIKEAEQVIMTDAHISDTALLFLDQLGVKDKIFIKNDYKHNKNIKATEIFSDIDLTTELNDNIKNEKPFMICCDSKNVADILYHSLGKHKDIGLFTSETLADINLDDWKYVIFSPKIVYGLDSLMPRPVYCVMKEHTISPDAMIQQANRCRNITELKYFFGRKSHGLYKYKSREEVYDTLTARENMAVKLMESLTTKEESEDYKKLLSHHLYNVDCLNTNKFAHFIRLLKDQGFIVDIDRKSSTNTLNKQAKIVKEIKVKDLIEIYEDNVELMEKDKQEYIDYQLQVLQGNIEHYEEMLLRDDLDNDEIKDYEGKLSREQGHLNHLGTDSNECIYLGQLKEKLLESIPYPEYVKNHIKLLRIQPLDVGFYGEILIDSHKITQHYLICKYFFKETGELVTKLEDSKEFSCKKGNNVMFKMLFLKKVLKEVGLADDLYNLYPPEYTMDKEKENSLREEYNIIFNNRSKKIPIIFREPYEATKMIVKMFKQIFGTKIIQSSKTTKIINKKIKCVTQYNLNTEIIYLSEQINNRSEKGRTMYKDIKY